LSVELLNIVSLGETAVGMDHADRKKKIVFSGMLTLSISYDFLSLFSQGRGNREQNRSKGSEINTTQLASHNAEIRLHCTFYG
jgi:hypothetical protein